MTRSRGSGLLSSDNFVRPTGLTLRHPKSSVVRACVLDGVLVVPEPNEGGFTLGGGGGGGGFSRLCSVPPGTLTVSMKQRLRNASPKLFAASATPRPWEPAARLGNSGASGGVCGVVVGSVVEGVVGVVGVVGIVGVIG